MAALVLPSQPRQEPGLSWSSGITIAELIDEFCVGCRKAQVLMAYLPRRIGRHFAATLNDIPLDFDTLRPYGCIHWPPRGDRAVAS